MNVFYFHGTKIGADSMLQVYTEENTLDAMYHGHNPCLIARPFPKRDMMLKFTYTCSNVQCYPLHLYF